jgi:hypothetical protein
MVLPTKEIIEKACKPSEWDFGNGVLYNLCKNNFKHEDDGKIIA